MPAAMYTLRLIKHEGNPVMHIGTSRQFLHSKSDDGAEVTASEGTVSHKFEGRNPAALYTRVECLEGDCMLLHNQGRHHLMHRRQVCS